MIFIDIEKKNWNRIYSDRSEQDLFDEAKIIWNFPFSQKIWWTNCGKLKKKKFNNAKKLLVSIV